MSELIVLPHDHACVDDENALAALGQSACDDACADGHRDHGDDAGLDHGVSETPDGSDDVFSQRRNPFHGLSYGRNRRHGCGPCPMHP